MAYRTNNHGLFYGFIADGELMIGRDEELEHELGRRDRFQPMLSLKLDLSCLPYRFFGFDMRRPGSHGSLMAYATLAALPYTDGYALTGRDIEFEKSYRLGRDIYTGAMFTIKASLSQGQLDAIEREHLKNWRGAYHCRPSDLDDPYITVR
jgi:hypothetical protein